MSDGRIDYGTAVPLSSGASGEVYRAYDAKLSRHVALKFLRSDDPAQVRRLAREAQTQANLPTHPNLCAIYGVGDYEGRPYIAMEYVEGEALDVVGSSLSVEARVRAIADVAAALEVAHAAGLVHRDIKPANIVLARADADGGGGDLRPVLVDFGTVWSADYRTMTRLGHFVGTPAYMAPEQVRGGHDALGPATDVYALGATLYALLTGAPPFDGSEPIRLLHGVLNDPPPRLRARWPEAPRALEAIVARCLEKSPSMRYTRAADLAADLRRHLAGEPVRAQPTRWGTQFAHRARRWRPALRITFAAAALAAVLLVALAARAQQRRAAVQRYDPIGQNLEGTLRAEYMSAAHDVRPAQRRVRQRIRALEALVRDQPGPARAPLRGAIGRGWLALGEADRGLVQLRAAWDSGHQTPAIAYALGRALSARYADARLRLGDLDDPRLRADAAATARRDRDAARVFLRRGRSAPSTAPAYIEALLLLHEADYDAALARAVAARATLPWRHEADELIGTILRQRAEHRFIRGATADAWRDVRAAEHALRTAARTAASDPRVALELCRLRVSMLRYGIEQAGAIAEASVPSMRAIRDQARVACRRALQLDADRASIIGERAALASVWAAYRMWVLGEDNRDDLRRGRSQALRAVAADPSDPALQRILGEIDLTHAQRILMFDLDDEPRPWLDLAALRFRRAARLPGGAYVLHQELGRLLFLRAMAEARAEVDAHRTLRQGVVYARRMTRRTPDEPIAFYNLAMTYSSLGENALHHGRPAAAALDAGRAAMRRALALDPDDPWARSNLASLLALRATAGFYRGEDPMPWIARAVAQLNPLLASSPDWVRFHGLRAGILLDAADMQLLRGRDPSPLLARAAFSLRVEAAASGAAGAVRPPEAARRHAESQLRLTLYEVRWRMARGTLVASLLPPAAALQALADDPATVTAAVQWTLLRVRRAIGASQPQRAAQMLDALPALEAVAARRGGVRRALRDVWRGEAQLLRAVLAPEPDARRRWLASARASWDDAERRNRWLVVYLAPLRAEADALAQDGAPKIARTRAG